jgi:hypothetical protein
VKETNHNVAPEIHLDINYSKERKSHVQRMVEGRLPKIALKWKPK